MEKEREQVREKAREKVKERARKKKAEGKRKKVKMKSEKRESGKGEDDKEDCDAWGGDGPWGVPTYPGAWTANLQLPCGSGLGWKAYF